MERLTFVDEGGRVLFTPKGCSQDIGYTIIQLMEDGHVDLLEEIAERLANCEQRLKGYEDIGPTPKQLMEVDKLYAEKCKELAESEKRSFSGLEMVKIWAKLKKLKEYQKLEEQGKLPKLPCAVGDTVWYISERTEKQGRKKVEAPFVDKGIVDNITLGCMMVPQISVCNDENVWITFDAVEDFGKTVFLTKEAAEAALKEMSE